MTPQQASLPTKASRQVHWLPNHRDRTAAGFLQPMMVALLTITVTLMIMGDAPTSLLWWHWFVGLTFLSGIVEVAWALRQEAIRSRASKLA